MQKMKIKNPLKVELPRSEKIENNNIHNEPSDWSSELTAIDSEILRLKWTRDDEVNFLNKTLGYNSRNKITKYSEIVNYLNLLRREGNENQSITINGNICNTSRTYS